MLKYDPYQVHFLSSCIGAAIGLSFLVAPSFFWNPQDGWMPNTFVHKTGFGDGTRFHPIAECGIRGAGSTMTSFCLFHLLFSKPTQQPFLLRCKMAMALLTSLLCAHVLLRGDPEVLETKFFLFCIWYDTFLLLGLWQVYQANFPGSHHLVSRKSWAPAAMVSFFYELPFGVILSFAPQVFGPQGRLPFFRTESLEDIMAEDTVQMVTARFEGLMILLWLYACWDSRHAPVFVLEILGALLYAELFLEGALDRTGYANRTASGAALAIHTLYIAFLISEWRKSRHTAHTAKKEPVAAPVNAPKNERTILGDLTTEEVRPQAMGKKTK